MAKKVVIGMSGGVDSSVAAYLLVKAGYEVIGVTMRIWEPEVSRAQTETNDYSERTCCSLSAVEDSRRVASALNIPFYVLNFKEIFAREVVEYFISSYIKGETPNPCILCNNKVKFQALLEKGRAMGAEFIATGHYAIKSYDSANGRYTLKRGKDSHKDQSYVLFGLSQEQLARALFPLGDLTKEDVRQIARAEGLPTAEKAESQEICFIPDHDYGRFLREERPESLQPGEIVDTQGRVLGRHQGVSFYTIGQRRGLGIAAPQPLYVVDLLPAERRVVVGPADQVFREGAQVAQVNWVSIPPPSSKIKALVKIRYSAAPVPAVIEPGDKVAYVKFTEPQRAVTPGQAIVFYDDDLLLGGGFITRI